MAESISIPSRFNGPLNSGNGGYSCGVVAGLITGTVEANLRAPVPLDRRLDVVPAADGSVQVLDGETLVIEARRASGPAVEVPAPVGVEQAREASTRYRGLSDGTFSRCFVCGRARDDAFGVFAGSVSGRDLVASPWVPPRLTADADGNVRSEFVWAVLDCPTYFALYASGELPQSVLARLTARLDAPVRVGEEHVVVAWPIELDGRKHHAGAAVISATGETLALARALLIAPRS